MFRKFLIQAALFLVFIAKLSGGGVFLYEISTSDTRLASAGWSARAEDPTTAFTNPAGMTRFHKKTAEFGAQAIYAHVRFNPNSNTSITGRRGHANKWLPSGSFSYVQPINDCFAVGFVNAGYFGSDLDYNNHWAGRYYVQSTMLEGISAIPSIAYKVNRCFSIGIGLNAMYGMLRQRSAVRNFLDLIPDGHLSVDDTCFGFGGLFGLLYEPRQGTRIGLQYLSPLRLNFRAKPKFSGIGPLLDEALTVAQIKGSSINLLAKVPQSIMLSAFHQVNPCIAVMGNVGWQQWSDFQKTTVTLLDTDRTHFRVRGKFKDCWHVALGAETKWREWMTLSAGVAYDSSVVTNKERKPDFPIGSQWRFGTGAKFCLAKNLTLDFSSELQWQGDLKMDVNLGPIAGRVSGTFKNVYAFFTSANLIYSF